MTPEVLAHAFEPFYTTKATGKGAGFGLATVYAIVTEAGGMVQLTSDPALGTTARVYFPAFGPVRATSEAEPPTKVKPGGGETILVVEDEPAVRSAAVRMLRRNGFRVLEAATGLEALSLLGDHTCDVLFTDVVMPQMSGRELVDRVHERLPGLPVVYVSGYTGGMLETSGAPDEGVTLLQKPFGEQELVDQVRAVLDAKGATPPRDRGIGSN
jgi:CheY-like chemotaxis protein